MTREKPMPASAVDRPAHIGFRTFRLTVILILAALSWAVIALIVHLGAPVLL